MKEPAPYGDILRVVRNRCLEDLKISAEELRDLLALCSHPDKNLRESALGLLLTPPVLDELPYYEWLTDSIASSTAPLGQVPYAPAELILDRLAFIEKLPAGWDAKKLFLRLLKGLTKKEVSNLLDRPLSMRSFGRHLPVNAFLRNRRGAIRSGGRKREGLRCGGGEAGEIKRRWRLFLRLLDFRGRTTGQPGWAEPTFCDLEPVFHHRPSVVYFSKGRWLKTARPLFFRASGPYDPSPVLSYWRGAGDRRVRFLDKLIGYQAKELRAVRELAVSVSKNSRRVVLSWHNASLAAAGGWGFEDPGTVFPSESLWKVFEASVRRRAKGWAGEMEGIGGCAEELRKLRQERLIAPKVLHALWESTMRLTLDPSWKENWQEDLRKARGFLDDETVSEVMEGKRYSWSGALSPHQRISMDRIISWSEKLKDRWTRGLALLAAMAQEAQALLDGGDIEYFVLPWIDKFFISSRREEDHRYLPALFRLLEQMGLEPLIAFWEDTARSQAPSFQLALKHLADRGYPFCGIGIFDWTGNTNRRDGADIMVQGCDKTRLFALRPITDTHNPHSLQRLLEDMDHSFFHSYDSSWKDNLSFIYTGTQVFPLLSVQCEMEPFAAWVAAGHRKHSFGSYLRRRLRYEALGGTSADFDSLFLEYARWANLC